MAALISQSLYRLPDEPEDTYMVRMALIEARVAVQAGHSIALAQRHLRRARDSKTTWTESERPLRIEADQFLGRI